MPYTESQNKLFRAAEHDPKIAKKVGIPQDTAKKLANEGVYKTTTKKDPKQLAKALMRK